MTIGDYVAYWQPNIYKALMKMFRFRPVKQQKKLESRKVIDRIMREIPGFKDRLPR